jgi:hypothetical protein
MTPYLPSEARPYQLSVLPNQGLPSGGCRNPQWRRLLRLDDALSPRPISAGGCERPGICLPAVTPTPIQRDLTRSRIRCRPLSSDCLSRYSRFVAGALFIAVSVGAPLCFVGLSASGRFGFDEAEHRASAAVEWLSPRWAILAAVLFTVSLVIYPSWPIVWLRSTSPYQGSRSPLFVLPGGPSCYSLSSAGATAGPGSCSAWR